MVVESKTIVQTYSPDGTMNVVQSFAPGAGELWYVDSFMVSSDGQGANQDTSAVGIRSGDTSTPGNLNNSNRYTTYASITVDGSFPQQSKATLGVYLTDAEELKVLDVDVADTATLTVMVTLRRVI